MTNTVFNFIAICNHCELFLDEYEAGIANFTEAEQVYYYGLCLQIQKS